jgi:hypothetical protein
MIGFKSHNRFSRLAVLAIALLLSNIVGLSCAMAYAMCSDCLERPPIICIDTCGAVKSVISDKAPDGSSGSRPPVVFRDMLLTPEPAFVAVTGTVRASNSLLHAPSPPLHVRFCVFLK